MYRHLLCVLAIAMGWVCASAEQAAGSYTYQLVNYPADQAGWTLSGWVTVNQLGAIGTPDIVDFSWTVSQSGQATYTLTQGTSGVYVGGAALTATATQLTFDATLLDCVLRLGDTNNSLQYASGINDLGDITPPYYLADGTARYWTTNDPAMNGVGLWVIAQNAAAPTPTAFGLFLFAAPLAMRRR